MGNPGAEGLLPVIKLEQELIGELQKLNALIGQLSRQLNKARADRLKTEGGLLTIAEWKRRHSASVSDSVAVHQDQDGTDPNTSESSNKGDV